MNDKHGSALFIGHGSPMNTFEVNQFTTAWREMSASLPTPRAIVAVSAHWYIDGTAVTAMSHPRTIHDFRGFPDELSRFDYPAIGDVDLANDIVSLLSSFDATTDTDDWGLDHGTWSVLAHLYPQADVPVVQLSIDALASFTTHMQIGACLAPLVDEGVMVLGSGNVVHNLGLIDWSMVDGGFEWAEQFDSEVRQIVTTQPSDLASIHQHRLFRTVAPTPEHFIPLLYVAGLAEASGRKLSTFAEGYTFGSLSMTSYAMRG